MKAKYIPTPERLYELWQQYVIFCKENPFKTNDFRGAEAKEVFLAKEQPPTIAGFEGWLSKNNIIHDISHYLANADGAYEEFKGVVEQIRAESKGVVLNGALANYWNANLAARYLGIANVTEQKVIHELPTIDTKKLSPTQLKQLDEIIDTVYNGKTRIQRPDNASV
ncbi:hypothetical protein ABDK00_013240 [Niabella insulamsoli]|uniref:hypothetical protein n=1 Tax=Niabella insulamsoli TaxID=3144874 RepID=UPI0031FE34C5